MAALWSGGVNVGARGHDAPTYPFLFRDEGTWFCHLIFKLRNYMHGIVHTANSCIVF